MKSSTIPVQIGWILRIVHEAALLVKLWQWQNQGTPVHQFWTSHLALAVVFLIVLWWFNTNGEKKSLNNLYLEKLFMLSCFWLTAFLLDGWELPFRELTLGDYARLVLVTTFVAGVLSAHLYFIVIKNE